MKQYVRCNYTKFENWYNSLTGIEQRVVDVVAKNRGITNYDEATDEELASLINIGERKRDQ